MHGDSNATFQAAIKFTQQSQGSSRLQKVCHASHASHNEALSNLSQCFSIGSILLRVW